MPSKAREVSLLPIQATYVAFDNQGNPTSGDGPLQNQHPRSREVITYQNGKHRENPCDHFKYIKNVFNSPHTFSGSDGSSITYFNDINFAVAGGPGLFSMLNPPQPSYGLDQFALRALQEIRPRLKSKISVPNFLFELKDFHRIFPSKNRISDLALIAKHGSKSQRANAGLDETSSQFLNASFGYLPLISDLGNWAEANNLFELRLYDFKKAAKKIQTGHYVEKCDNLTTTFAGPVVNGAYAQISRITYSDVRYVCSIGYSYEITGDIPSPLNIFSKYVGFRNNPRIIWDALPFSFIVDWSLKIGKSLESFDDGALPTNMVINYVTMSLSYVALIENYCYDVPSSSGTWNFGSERLESTERFEVYQRWPSNMDARMLLGVPPLPVTDGLSVKEILLAAALGRTLTR